MGGRIKQKNPGWLAKVLKRAKAATKHKVAIGYPKGTDAVSASYPDGTAILNVAAWNNFGTRTIPPRPFMFEGALKALEETRPLVKKRIKDINSGKIKAEVVLKEMGIIGSASISLAIRDLREPPNAPATIRMKGSANPLVDTGLLAQSATWAIRKD